MSETVPTVGQTVARARTDAGLTVTQVATATRVRAAVIEAIEKDDFRLCGGDVYARGHLKSIATAVGLNPVALAAQYDAQRGTERAVAEPVAPIEQPTKVSERTSAGDSLGALAGTLGASVSRGRTGPNWSAVMALALAVIIGAGAISWLSNRPSSSGVASGPTGSPSPTVSSGTQPSTPSTQPSTPSTQPTTPAPSPSDVVAAADGVTVKLTVTGAKSWVRVTAGSGGRTLYEGILNQGQTKTFKDKQKIALVIGNAGAVTLKVNGRDLGAPGSGGQVVKVTFGPGDPNASAA
ncbi:MAG TPA: RodZ domain-containing protein [Candidatus Nanopelagicales bacterium]|nr:RodZ domain-containing protein [Candidatus Nanopelagicales bacterium]